MSPQKVSLSLLRSCWRGTLSRAWLKRMHMSIGQYDLPAIFLHANRRFANPWIFQNLFQLCSFARVHLEHAANDTPGFPWQKPEESPGAFDGHGLRGRAFALGSRSSSYAVIGRRRLVGYVVVVMVVVLRFIAAFRVAGAVARSIGRSPTPFCFCLRFLGWEVWGGFGMSVGF